MQVMEDLLKRFLLSENITATELFDAVRQYSDSLSSGTEEAKEIVDFVSCYCDFPLWCSHMKELAREKLASSRNIGFAYQFQSASMSSSTAESKCRK